MDAATAFNRCVMSAAGGFGVAWLGIPALEVHAALSLMGVPTSEWPQVSADVAAMGRIAAEGFNRRKN